MAVNAVQNNNNSTMSYKKSIAVGAITGYALKWALPITPQEKDLNYTLELNRAKAEAKLAKTNELSAIINAKPKTKAIDTFSKLHSTHKLTQEEIAKLPESLRAQVTALKARPSFKFKEAFKIGLNKAIVITKGIRSKGIFITTGAVVALAYAFTHNVIKGMATNSTEENQDF